MNWGHGDFQSPALPTELSRLQPIYPKLRCVVCETHLLNFYILIKDLMNEMYYFALIAIKAVPNESFFYMKLLGY